MPVIPLAQRAQLGGEGVPGGELIPVRLQILPFLLRRQQRQLPTLAFALQGRIAQQRSRNNRQRQPHHAELWPDQHCRQHRAENDRGLDLVTALNL